MIIFPCQIHIKLVEKAVKIFENITNKKSIISECLYKNIEIEPQKLAELRVLNPLKKELNSSPSNTEIEFEKSKIKECKCGKGIIYDASSLANYLKNKECIQKLKFSQMPVFITLDYIATFDVNDRRWHLRYAFFFFPTIISINGIIDAPAKPKEYYIYLSKGILPEMMPSNLKEKYLNLQDERLPRVLAGIMLQSYAFYKIKNPFCEDKFCSLYNAHRQEELIASQKDKPYILCENHKKLLINV